MSSYARVAVNLPIRSGLFDYLVPDQLAGQIQPGMLAEVPFGPRQVQGLVWELARSTAVTTIKPITRLLDPAPVLTPALLRLAGWLERETLAPLAECFDLMLPPGLSQQADTLYSLSGSDIPLSELKPLQSRLYQLLSRRGGLRGRQIDAHFGQVDWRATAAGMRRRGWIVTEAVLPPPAVRPRTTRTVRLVLPLEEALEHARPANEHPRSRLAALRRQAVLRYLAGEGQAVETEWALAGSESDAAPADLQRLAELGAVEFGESESWRDPLGRMEFVLSQPPLLTDAQNTVLQKLLAGLRASAKGETPMPFLLHGITGSGKTEIYLRAAAEVLAQGRQVLVLVPEISLTPQTVRRFAARFPGKVGLVHSRLSAGERYDTWRRARSGGLSLVVGPRSALFTPFPNLGLIVLDEFHDSSYYQSEPDPAYHAVTAALALAQFSGAVALLGSATPDVSLYERGRREGWTFLHLPDRVLAHREAVRRQHIRLGRSLPEPAGEMITLPLPEVRIVDMREELHRNNRSIFSIALQDEIDGVLARGEQAILLLNRRGSATYVFCRDCGESLDCPRCNLPLTWHEGNAGLICHICGYKRRLPARCPACRSPQIARLGLGTEKAEADVRARWPGARVMRWDAETAAEKDAADLMLARFAAHGADILLGTQVVAKGLDLPLVTLAAALLSDIGLVFPDYRAAERSFQLMTQLAGRAGRSPLGGRAIFQTYQPQHYALQAAAKHDFPGFLRQELEKRQNPPYPPFARLLRLELAMRDEEQARREALRMGNQVQAWLEEGAMKSTRLIGPVPCYYARRAGAWRWQILLAGPDPVRAVRGRNLGEWRVTVDPANLL